MAKLGDRVKDRVSGFEGIVIAQHNYLYGCTRFSVQSSVGNDGKLPDSYAFDDLQLDVLQEGVVEPNVPVLITRLKETGGPGGHIPSARPIPKR